MKTISKITYVPAFVCAFALLFGCSKKDEAPVSLNDANSAATVQKAIEETKAAEAPKANKATPLEQYQELSGGKQLLFAHQALSNMPVDYEKIAESISDDYRRQSDDFKKRDILSALKPGIEKEISKAKESRYYYSDEQATLSKYDFDLKNFGLGSMGEKDYYRYFTDISGYHYKYINGDKFNKIFVPDEAKARIIENLRTKYDGMKLRVYFFMADTELGKNNILVEITKIVLTDSKGTVLAEI